MPLWDDAIAPYIGGQQQPQDNSSLWGQLASLVQSGQPFTSGNPALAQMTPPPTQLPPDLEAFRSLNRLPSTGPGDYAQRRAQALEEGQGELEESQRSMPGYAEGQTIPDARLGTALNEEAGVAVGRELPLWWHLWRQQEIDRMYRQLRIGQERSI